MVSETVFSIEVVKHIRKNRKNEELSEERPLLLRSPNGQDDDRRVVAKPLSMKNFNLTEQNKEDRSDAKEHDHREPQGNVQSFRLVILYG